MVPFDAIEKSLTLSAKANSKLCSPASTSGSLAFTWVTKAPTAARSSTKTVRSGESRHTGGSLTSSTLMKRLVCSDPPKRSNAVTVRLYSFSRS